MCVYIIEVCTMRAVVRFQKLRELVKRPRTYLPYLPNDVLHTTLHNNKNKFLRHNKMFYFDSH